MVRYSQHCPPQQFKMPGVCWTLSFESQKPQTPPEVFFGSLALINNSTDDML